MNRSQLTKQHSPHCLLPPHLPSRPTLWPRQTDMSGALQQTNKERDFLRSLNETLLANQQDFQKQLTAVKAELVAKEDANRDLQEQVRGNLR